MILERLSRLNRELKYEATCRRHQHWSTLLLVGLLSKRGVSEQLNIVFELQDEIEKLAPIVDNKPDINEKVAAVQKSKARWQTEFGLDLSDPAVQKLIDDAVETLCQDTTPTTSKGFY